NYSRAMLDHMHSLLDDVTEVSKIFILKLLYHNKPHELNQNLKEELITGLLEKAYILDWSGTLHHDGIESLLAKKEHFETIRRNLESDSHKLIQSAASNLIYHHQSRLTVKEKAKCWLYHVQYSES